MNPIARSDNLPFGHGYHRNVPGSSRPRLVIQKIHGSVTVDTPRSSIKRPSRNDIDPEEIGNVG